MTGGVPAPRDLTCAAIVAIAACSRTAPLIGSCDDDLRGIYVAGSERWMVLDNGATLEAYPVFPDATPVAPSAGGDEVVVAPRVIDLQRAGSTPGAPPAGTLRRRYMLRAQSCEARVPVHVTRCAGDTLELVLADPSPPIGFSPCAWLGPAPSRVVRWRRE